MTTETVPKWWWDEIKLHLGPMMQSGFESAWFQGYCSAATTIFDHMMELENPTPEPAADAS